MARITEVTVSYRKVVQVKPYEPVDLSVGATASLEIGESRKGVTAHMYKVLKKQVYELMLEDLKDHGLVEMEDL